MSTKHTKKKLLRTKSSAPAPGATSIPVIKPPRSKLLSPQQQAAFHKWFMERAERYQQLRTMSQFELWARLSFSEWELFNVLAAHKELRDYIERFTQLFGTESSAMQHSITVARENVALLTRAHETRDAQKNAEASRARKGKSLRAAERQRKLKARLLSIIKNEDPVRPYTTKELQRFVEREVRDEVMAASDLNSRRDRAAISEKIEKIIGYKNRYLEEQIRVIAKQLRNEQPDGTRPETGRSARF